MQRGSPSGETAKEAGRLAAEAGMASGLKALGVSSVSVFLAQRYWPAFRHGLNVSGKTAIVVMPFFFYFFLDAEHKLSDIRTKNMENLKLKKGHQRGN
jgi:hypothetical protein